MSFPQSNPSNGDAVFGLFNPWYDEPPKAYGIGLLRWWAHDVKSSIKSLRAVVGCKSSSSRAWDVGIVTICVWLGSV